MCVCISLQLVSRARGWAGSITTIKEKIPTEKFDGLDFRFWKMQIEDYLYGNDLYHPLNAKLENMDLEEWELLHREMMSAICLSLSMNVSNHTIKAKLAKNMLSISEQM